MAKDEATSEAAALSDSGSFETRLAKEEGDLTFGFQVCPVPPTTITWLAFLVRQNSLKCPRKEMRMSAPAHQSRQSANYTGSPVRNSGKPFNSTAE
jgi:hypothetical protein